MNPDEFLTKYFDLGGGWDCCSFEISKKPPGLKTVGLHIVAICFALTLSFGQDYRIQPKEERANDLYKRGVAAGDSGMIAEAMYQYGTIANEKKEREKSIEWFNRALAIYQQQQNFYKCGRVYIFLATHAFETDNLTQGLKHLHTAEAFFRKAKSEQGLMMVYGGLGRVHYKDWPINEKNIVFKDSGLVYLKMAESIAQRIDPKALPELWQYIGNILIDQNDKKGLAYLEKSVASTYKAYQYKPAMPPIHGTIDLARAYITLKNYDKATRLLEKSKREISVYDAENIQLNTHLESEYVHLYSEQNDWKNAFVHLKNLKTWDEKMKIGEILNNPPAINKVIREAAQLANERVESKLKDEAIRAQKRFIYIVAGLCILMILLSLILYSFFNKYQQVSRKNASLLQEQNHRVKNNLQVVSSLLNLQARGLHDTEAKQAIHESQLRIEAMVVLHRQLYENEELEKINLRLFVEDLCSIVFQAFGLNVALELKTSSESLEADKAIFYGLLLNELVNNACKYAFVNHENPILRIEFSQHFGRMLLTVKDNGKNKVSEADLYAKSSFGQKLINMMAVQLDGRITYTYREGLEFKMIIS
jgi:two-component sensor histidine kinase